MTEEVTEKVTRQTAKPIGHTNFQPTFRRATELVRLADEGSIDLRPPYQRTSIWSDAQRLDLVKSWLTGVPTGTLILADRGTRDWRAPDGTNPLDTSGALWGCVDGQQRLTTAALWFASQSPSRPPGSLRNLSRPPRPPTTDRTCVTRA
ncbi:DUF262 domain-containing protein [Streptomyces sp. NPDC058247]|uniref:DUF262 domain-containing protein n=1 Tax=Streptomyces sp. NPDC058247 TaxID=3346401 RepID=UPI0036E32E78